MALIGLTPFTVWGFTALYSGQIGSGPVGGYYLKTDGTNSSWQPVVGVAGNPGGSNTQLQYNSGGVFAGTASITYTTPSTTIANNLVLSTSTNNSSFRSPDVVFWGDSEIYGSGYNGLRATSSVPALFSVASGLGSYNGGVSGETSALVAVRALATPDKLTAPTVIWAGRNDVNGEIPNATIIANIQSIITALPSPKRFVLMSVLNHASTTIVASDEATGTSKLTNILALNTLIGSTAVSNGGQYFDVRGYLVSLGTAGEIASDTPAIAYMADNTHPNTAGNTAIANYLNTYFKSYLIASSSLNNGNVVTYSNLNKAFQSPPTIGSVVPSGGFFRGITINASTTLMGVKNQTGYDQFLSIFGTKTPTGGGNGMGITDYSPSGGVPMLPEVILYDSNGSISNEIRAPLSSLYDTFIGYGTGGAVTNGTYNTVFGSTAFTQDTTGSNNTSVGYGTLNWVTTGSNNTAIGQAAGNQNGLLDGTGSNNIFIGQGAGQGQSSGNHNIIIGQNINPASTTGSNQIDIGNMIYGTGITASGQTVSTGYVGIGSTTPSNALEVNGNIYASGNITCGGSCGGGGGSVGSTNPFQATYFNSTSTSLLGYKFNSVPIAFGSTTGQSWWFGNAGTTTGTGWYSVGVGDHALMNLITSTTDTTLGGTNVAVGRYAGAYITTGKGNVAFGNAALNGNGTQNVMVGDGSGGAMNGSSVNYNTGVGHAAFQGLTTGTYNTCIGDNCGYGLTTGNFNTALGRYTGPHLNTADGNTLVGYNADTTGDFQYSIAIGYNAYVGCSNCAVIGGTGGVYTNVAIGTSTPEATLQVTRGANATTTFEVGTTGQTSKGSCLILYDNTGTVKYVSIVGGAFLISATSCK